MEGSEEMMDEDLRTRMQNNIELCEQYATFMNENVTIRMATLVCQLSSAIFNAIRGEPVFDIKILNELSQHLYTDNAANFEHASVVLAFKNFVILAELSVRLREREVERNERAENAPAYDNDRYSIERSLPRYFMESPKRPKHEVDEAMDPVVQELANSESGRQSYFENSDEMELEETKKFESDNNGWLESMDDGHRMVESGERDKESGNTTSGVTKDDGRMNRKNEICTEKEDSSVVRNEKEKKEEETSNVRSERKKRNHSTIVANLDEGQTENTTVGSQSLNRKARKIVSVEGKDEEKEDEGQSTNDDLSHRSSTKRAKSERTSLVTKTTVKRMSLGAKRTDLTNSTLSKAAAAFGLTANTFKCPFCDENFGCCAIDDHFGKVHKAEKLKLFGCPRCNSWHRLPNNALKHHRESGCKLSIRTVDEAKNQLSKTAAAFGLKSNTLECPFCDETFRGRLADHLRTMHKAKRHMKMFGCDNCDSWCRMPNDAMKHHREKGCKLRIRTIDETKKWNVLHFYVSEDEEELDGNDTKEKEVLMPTAGTPAEAGKGTAAPSIDYGMTSELSVMTSESINALSMTASNEQKPVCDKAAK